jgi:hypothetical protein
LESYYSKARRLESYYSKFLDKKIRPKTHLSTNEDARTDVRMPIGRIDDDRVIDVPCARSHGTEQFVFHCGLAAACLVVVAS